VDEHVDGGGEFVRLGQRVGARLERLGGAVEDLAAVVGGAPRPGARRLARGGHCVAHVLARRARDVGDVLVVGAQSAVVAAGLRAHERASHVELVGLANVEPCHETRR
jgi:hypothetical protein